MSYLAWYLGVGAVVLAGLLAFNRLSKDSGSLPLSLLPGSDDPDREKLWYRTLFAVVVALGAGVLFAAWPVLLCIVAKQTLSKKTASTVREKREFAVALGDLQEQLTIEEIERREQVIDPLGAVPDLPFGHLHSAWQKFLEAMEPQDAIWTFSAHWTTTRRRPELRAGYVVVRDGTMGPHILTLLRPLDED